MAIRGGEGNESQAVVKLPSICKLVNNPDICKPFFTMSPPSINMNITNRMLMEQEWNWSKIPEGAFLTYKWHVCTWHLSTTLLKIIPSTKLLDFSTWLKGKTNSVYEMVPLWNAFASKQRKSVVKKDRFHLIEKQCIRHMLILTFKRSDPVILETRTFESHRYLHCMLGRVLG